MEQRILFLEKDLNVSPQRMRENTIEFTGVPDSIQEEFLEVKGKRFRATPHPSTGVSPAMSLIQGRQVRSRLPEINKLYMIMLEREMLIKNER